MGVSLFYLGVESEYPPFAAVHHIILTREIIQKEAGTDGMIFCKNYGHFLLDFAAFR